MKKMYLLTVFILLVALTILGYGTVNSSLISPNTTTTSSAPVASKTTNIKSNENTWIEFAWYSASQFSIKPEYWALTKTRVGKFKVGHILAEIDDPHTQSGWHSNNLSVGTKIFCIPGIDFRKAFAVQMEDGSYLKAIAAGLKNLHTTNRGCVKPPDTIGWFIYSGTPPDNTNRW